MASLRTPVLTISITSTSTGSSAACTVVTAVIFDTPDLQFLTSGGAFIVNCRLEPHDPAHLGVLFRYPRQFVRAMPSGGSVAMDGVTFRATMPVRTLNEDIIGRDEIQAVAELSDDRGNFLGQSFSAVVRIRA